MMTMKREPKLRFPGFEGEWEEKKLKEVAAFKKGNTLSKSDLNSEGQKCILYGELYTKYGPIIKEVYSRTCCENKNLFYAKKGDVLIPSSGETAIDIATASCLQVDDVIIGGDLTVLTNIEEMDSRFISYQINGVKKQKLSTFAQGATVIHLYANHLKDFKVSNPSFPEQQKIADCLTAMDDTIEAQQQKVEQLQSYKKGLLQQLFSQTLRFPGFEGEWEEKKLGEFLFEYSDKDNSKLNKVVAVGKYGIRLREEIYSKELSKDISKNKVIHKNTLTIGMGTKQIDIGVLHEDKVYSVSPAYTTFKLTDVNSLFIDAYLQVKNSHLSALYMVIGAREGKSVDKESLLKHKLLFPHLPEQQKIADCLSLLDEKIELETQKLEKLQTYKKGLLQQLFV